MSERTSKQRRSTAAEIAAAVEDVDATETDAEPDLGNEFAIDLLAEVDEIETFPVGLGDLTINFPTAPHWSVQVISDFTAGRVMEAFTGMNFNQEELDALGQINGKQLVRLVEHINKVSGDSLGEAPTSARSSRSTATRLKPTSDRNTKSTSGTTSGRASGRAS